MTTQRQRGPARSEFGSVDQLPSGRWRGRYRLPDGRRRSLPCTFDAEDAAREALILLRAKLVAGDPVVAAPSSTTVAGYARAYLDHAGTYLRPRTVDLYERTAKAWILAPVGTAKQVDVSRVRLQALTPALVRSWWAALLDSTRQSAITRKHSGKAAVEVPANVGRMTTAIAYRLLRTIMGQAVADGIIAVNPVHIKGASRADHPERLPLNPAEV